VGVSMVTDVKINKTLYLLTSPIVKFVTRMFMVHAEENS
jgi:hypothetical protein